MQKRLSSVLVYLLSTLVWPCNYLFACRNYQSCYEAITNAQSTRLQSWLPTSSESNSKMTNPNCRAFRMLFVLRLTVF